MAQTTDKPGRTLIAGRLHALYRDGALRYIRLGDMEVLRHVYIAVRDHNWATIPIAVTSEEVTITTDGFEIALSAEHRQGDIDFRWKGRIAASVDRIEFVMDGTAASSFLKNRIGMCVLHGGTECAGRQCSIEHADGTSTESHFPMQVSPHQPFLDVRSITHEPVPGVRATVTVEGEYFETEDQRNWTDDSFKTYSTRLSEPFPVRVEAGHRVRHKLILQVQGEPLPVIRLSEEQPRSLPHIGTAAGTRVISDSAAEALRGLKLHHIRADVRPADSGWEERFGQASALAERLGATLEAAVHVTGDVRQCLEAVAASAAAARVRQWMIYDEEEPATTPETLTVARALLSGLIGGGTYGNFADFNRNRAAAHSADFICFSANPQVHGTDELTMVETLPGQFAAVRSAQAFSGGKPVAVTPVTLRTRGQADPREASPFNAVWTLGSLSSLAHAGAFSVTFHEAEGLMSNEGKAYPVLRLFEQLAELSPDAFQPCSVSQPFETTALVLQHGTAATLMIGNLKPQTNTVFVDPLRAKVTLEPHEIKVIDL